MKKINHKLLQILLLCLSFIIFTTVVANIPLTQSSANKSTKTTKRLWNLRNADLLSVIDEISRETGKNFIVDPRVQGKVTIVASHAMSSDEVYQAFLSMLQVLGYAAVPTGDVIKIVPSLDAKQNGVPLEKNNKDKQGDEVVVQVIKIKHGSALQLVPVLRPLLPQWAEISAYRPANALIISGAAQAVNRISDVVRRVDASDNNAIDVVKLKFAGASQIVSTLNYLQQANRSNGVASHVALAADDRTNSVLVSGDQGVRMRMHILIERLDKQPSKNEGNIEVIYLHYLQANKLAKVLGGDSDVDSEDDADTHQAVPGYSAKMGVSMRSQTSRQNTNTNLSDVLSNSGRSPWGKHVVIRAEPATNALIIKAPPMVMRSIKNVIARLDIRPAQVLVQAIIVEISNSTMKQLGIQWGTVGSAAIPSVHSDSGDQPHSSAGSAFEKITGGLGLGLLKFGNFKSLINILEQDNNTNILSTPSLVVLDNQKAEIKVGKKLSVVSGSYAASSASPGTVNPYTTTEQEDVGLKLDVTPQINDGSAVRLNLQQSNATLDGSRVVNSNPVTNNTLIKTSVIVNDGDILVLGGLTTNELENSIQKVPVLGDIPLLGLLFRHKGHTMEKKNLMIFLKPIIIRNATDASNLSFSKYRYIRSKQWQRIKEKHQQGDSHLPLLPAWPGKNGLPTPFVESVDAG